MLRWPLSSCATALLSTPHDPIKYSAAICTSAFNSSCRANKCLRVGWNNATALSPYGEYLKIHRKGITKIAGSSVSVSAFNRVQEVEAAHFLLNMLDSPEGLFDHIRT